MSEPTEQQQYDSIFAYYKEQAKIVPIDANMRLLVETLNKLRGIATVACCGGHENPRRDQRPAGEWFVTIEVYPYDKRGWDDLSILCYAVSQTNGRVVLDFTARVPGFFLTGKNIPPDDFATQVFKERARRRRIK